MAACLVYYYPSSALLIMRSFHFRPYAYDLTSKALYESAQLVLSGKPLISRLYIQEQKLLGLQILILRSRSWDICSFVDTNPKLSLHWMFLLREASNPAL